MHFCKKKKSNIPEDLKISKNIAYFSFTDCGVFSNFLATYSKRNRTQVKHHTLIRK